MGKLLHGPYLNDREPCRLYYVEQLEEMFPETEGFLLAIKVQVIRKINYLKHIVRDPSVHHERCRFSLKEIGP